MGEVLCHAHRTRAGASAAVRRGECLVKVDVHDVEAHVAGTHLAEKRVEVGPVVIEESAGVVHELGDLDNLGLEHADRVGVGHHDACHGVVEQRLEVFDVDRPIGTRLDFHNLQTAHHCGGGVRAMGRVGNDHFRALKVPREM